VCDNITNNLTASLLRHGHFFQEMSRIEIVIIWILGSKALPQHISSRLFFTRFINFECILRLNETIVDP